MLLSSPQFCSSLEQTKMATTYAFNYVMYPKRRENRGSFMPISSSLNRSSVEQIKMVATEADYLRDEQLKASFFNSKAGVKGLVDSGVERIPSFFFRNFELPAEKPAPGEPPIAVPVIDFGGIDIINGQDTARSEVVERIRDACENWGFFQVVNHGIPVRVTDEIIDVVRRFHEQDAEKKIPYCTNDKSFKYNHGSFDISKVKKVAWLDTVSWTRDHLPPRNEDLPELLRNPTVEYTDYMMKLGRTLNGLFSEALGLEKNYLQNIGCGDGLSFFGHYYPPCPEPDLTLGAHVHTDASFMNLILQEQVGGLQFHYKNQWVDVPPLSGAVVVNLGDMMQLVTNGKFRSLNHRVLTRKTGSRVSIACFMKASYDPKVTPRMYGPIKELLSEENPPIYKDTTIMDYMAWHRANLSSDNYNPDPLSHFKL